MTFPLVLSHRNAANRATISSKATKELPTYQKNLIRFIYDCFVKKRHGAILNVDMGMNPEHASSLAVKALYDVNINNLTTVILCTDDDRSLYWLYFMKHHCELEVFKITENNIDRLLKRNEALILIVVEKDFKIFRNYVKDYNYFCLIVDQVDHLIGKQLIGRINADFQIGITHRNFIRNQDAKLRWKIINWVTCSNKFKKFEDFLEYDEAYMKERIDPYSDFWYTLTSDLCDSVRKSRTNENGKKLEQSIMEWARSAGLLPNSPPAAKTKTKSCKQGKAGENSSKSNDNMADKLADKIENFDYWTDDEPDLSVFEVDRASGSSTSPKPGISGTLRLTLKKPSTERNSSGTSLFEHISSISERGPARKRSIYERHSTKPVHSSSIIERSRSKILNAPSTSITSVVLNTSGSSVTIERSPTTVFSERSPARKPSIYERNLAKPIHNSSIIERSRSKILNAPSTSIASVVLNTSGSSVTIEHSPTTVLNASSSSSSSKTSRIRKSKSLFTEFVFDNAAIEEFSKPFLQSEPSMLTPSQSKDSIKKSRSDSELLNYNTHLNEAIREELLDAEVLREFSRNFDLDANEAKTDCQIEPEPDSESEERLSSLLTGELSGTKQESENNASDSDDFISQFLKDNSQVVPNAEQENEQSVSVSPETSFISSSAEVPRASSISNSCKRYFEQTDSEEENFITKFIRNDTGYKKVTDVTVTSLVNRNFVNVLRADDSNSVDEENFLLSFL